MPTHPQTPPTGTPNRLRQRPAAAPPRPGGQSGTGHHGHPAVELLGETTRVLVEQVGAVAAGRLGELVGRVTPQQQWGIDDTLMTVLGLH